MKYFCTIGTFLLLTLDSYAQDGNAQVPKLQFDGQEYTFHHAGNTSLALQNYYYPTGQDAEKSAARIVRGTFIGIGDCLAYAQAIGKSIKSKQPDASFSLMPDSNPNAALFAQLTSSSNGNFHTIDIWHLVKPDPKFPAILVTQFSLRASGPDARSKLSALLNERLKVWSAGMLKGKFPAPVLPFKKETVGDHSAAGGLVKVEGFKAGAFYNVDANFAKKLGGSNPPPAPFKVTVPLKYKKSVVINGAPNVPEIAVFAITDEHKQIIESVHYTTFRRAKNEEIVGKLPFFAALIEVQLAIPAVKPKGGRAIDRYRTKIGGMDAAVVLTEIKRPDGSSFFQKFIALPQPGEEQGLIIIGKVDTSKSPDVKTANDLTSKGFAAQVLHSTEFIKAE